MKILLISMPNVVGWINYFSRLPNLAIVSLAGNLPGHQVQVLDLVCCRGGIRGPLEGILRGFRPRLVGLSAMSFQFGTLLRVAGFIRSRDPDVKIVAGGYHTTLMAEEIAAGGSFRLLDFMVRGEGEITFAKLAAELEKPDPDFSRIKGLSYREGQTWRHNPERPLAELAEIRPPDRSVRRARDFHFFGASMDVAESSRGCPFNCKFCSINQMYGRTFRRFPLDRVIADLQAIREQGARSVFFVDDNITYDVDHFRNLCRAIVEHGLNDLFFLVQATAVGIAENPGLAAEMTRANFRIVFVGFESMSPESLRYVKKPTSPRINRLAAESLRRHNIAVIAGFIGGYPDDDKETLVKQYRMLRELRPDGIYAQYLTPYPKTVIRREMLEAGLVTNPDDFSKYDGFTCNIRTRHLTERELYLLLKRESLKSLFSRHLVFGNYFLKRFLPGALKGFFPSVAANIYHDQLGIKRRETIDL